VIPEKDDNVFLSARNIPRVKVSRVSDLNPYEILTHETILITKSALDRVPEVFKL
jgi:large subunit ribosomal protein L4